MVESMFVTLGSKVALLLTFAMLAGGLGAYLMRNLQSIGVWIGLVIGCFAGIFITMAAFHVSPLAGGISLTLWSAVVGGMAGPAVRQYKEELGAETVAGAFFGTAGVMAVCGLIATFSGINFGSLGGILSLALWGLIIFGLVGIFIRLSSKARIIESCVGMVVFAGYFLFDFWRLAHKSENSWKDAGELTMNLYLDFWNFFLYLLQFLAETKDKGHAAIQGCSDTLLAMVGSMPETFQHGMTFAQHAVQTMGMC